MTLTSPSPAARPSPSRPLPGPRTDNSAFRPAVGRIPILSIEPTVEAGRYPAKSAVGEAFPVTATIFHESRSAIGAQALLFGPDGAPLATAPMRESDDKPDRWTARLVAPIAGDLSFAVEAWTDPIESWRQRAAIKIPADVDRELEFEEGARLLERVAQGLGEPYALTAAIAELRDESIPALQRLAVMDAQWVRELCAVAPLRDLLTISRRLPLRVDRTRALYGSWYEFFPRSEGAVLDPAGRRPPVSGTLRTAARRLPAIAAMGFDVVYLPPVHPIGVTARKGPGNSPVAGPHDVGSPWAIGSADGGHTTIHPDLGTLDDFADFVTAADEAGLEVALDFALQCSPDHPWVTEHPEWFARRADGSIAYAENPPKKYQDIYPIDFDRDLPGITAETLRTLRFWMARGVRIFRVDNPHTKPVAFWEAVLAELRRTDPDVLLLSEAFTRPEVMQTLAKAGFHQSYTYFTWRETKQELTEYLTQLSGPTASYLRPNFFVNTPDILPRHLQTGGRAGFEIRAVLAATMAPSWGVYSGFELCEDEPAEPDGEEYAHSEKYELRPRDWTTAHTADASLAPLIAELNRIRRQHPALHQLRDINFLDTDDEHVLAYAKHSPDGGDTVGGDTVIVIVNLDPHTAREAAVTLSPLSKGSNAPLAIRDLITGGVLRCGDRFRIELDPDDRVAGIYAVIR